MGNFFPCRNETEARKEEKIKSCLGIVSVSSKQASKLGLDSRQRRSPLLEKCCLILAANESYQHAERDMELLTGIKVGHSTQHRCVQQQNITQPNVNRRVAALSIDGGKVRLRTKQQGASEWRDYKAISLHGSKCAAFFQDNESLLTWSNSQPLSEVVTCLGDGHDGVWNLMSQIGQTHQRREVLDWFHLKENLYKVGGSIKRLKKVESYLWQEMLADAKLELVGANQAEVSRFCAYVNKHHQRIPDYGLYQELGICIGSGSVESTIKQIGMRIKLSGAQWNKENVSQILKLRCAYLNGDIQIGISAYA